MNPRVRPWDRFLRYTTRIVGSAARIVMVALILGGPTLKLQIYAALCLSIFLVFAILKERRSIRAIEASGPQDFGPGQVRLSRPYDLDVRKRLRNAASLHGILALFAGYGALSQPEIVPALILLFGISACASVFRTIAFHTSTDQREYLVLSVATWDEVQRHYARFQELPKSERGMPFLEALRDLPLSLQARLFILSAMPAQDHLQVETADEES